MIRLTKVRKCIHKKRRGFTLVELLVVVSIIAILAVIGLVIYRNLQRSSRDARRMSDLKSVANAMEMRYYNGGSYSVVGSSDFSSDTIPNPPEGGGYYLAIAGDHQAFTACARLEDHDPSTLCGFSSSDCFCLNNRQGNTYAPAGAVAYSLEPAPVTITPILTAEPTPTGGGSESPTPTGGGGGSGGGSCPEPTPAVPVIVVTASSTETGMIHVTWAVCGSLENGFKITWAEHAGPIYPDDMYYHEMDNEARAFDITALSAGEVWHVRVGAFGYDGAVYAYSNDVMVTVR